MQASLKFKDLVELYSNKACTVCLFKVERVSGLAAKRVWFINQRLDVLCLRDRLGDLEFRADDARHRFCFNLERHRLLGSGDPQLQPNVIDQTSSYAGVNTTCYSFSLSRLGRFKSIIVSNSFRDPARETRQNSQKRIGTSQMQLETYQLNGASTLKFVDDFEAESGPGKANRRLVE